MRRHRNQSQTQPSSARVHLNRALSKLGILTRSQATAAILEGRVRVFGRVVRDPSTPVDLDGSHLIVDDEPAARAAWRTVLLYKPRGVVTTRSDPEQRRTVYDVMAQAAAGLVPVGRLDMATSGLLVLTSDTRLLEWITNPDNRVMRTYLATVRGRVTHEEAVRLEAGLSDGQGPLKAERVLIRKTSGRESHLTIELREGRNREVRRLCEGIGHEVTRLKRVGLGGFALDGLVPGAWRDVMREEVERCLPGFKV